MGKVTGKEEGWKTVGACGGSEGEPWDYKPDGPILQITVWYDEKIIRGISFQSEVRDGVVIGSPLKIGRTEGGKNKSGYKILTEKVRIDGSKEQLLSITVECDCYLRSLTFRTNLKMYGPHGSTHKFSDTTVVSLQIEGQVIAGFHGRVYSKAFNTPTAIGVYAAPKVKTWHSTKDPDSGSIQHKKIEEQKKEIQELKKDVKVLKEKMKMKEKEEKEEELKKEIKELKTEIKGLKEKLKMKEKEKTEEELEKEIKGLKADIKVLKDRMKKIEA